MGGRWGGGRSGRKIKEGTSPSSTRMKAGWSCTDELLVINTFAGSQLTIWQSPHPGNRMPGKGTLLTSQQTAQRAPWSSQSPSASCSPYPPKCRRHKAESWFAVGKRPTWANPETECTGTVWHPSLSFRNTQLSVIVGHTHMHKYIKFMACYLIFNRLLVTDGPSPKNLSS